MSKNNNQPCEDLQKLGEFGLIDHLTQNLKTVQPSTLKGVGDDAAVIAAPEKDEALLLTTDLLIEGIHFDLTYVPLRHLGYKAVIVNLSDIYAMNGTPRQITVSIAISNRFSLEAVEELYAGIRLACSRYGVDLVGGDTSSTHAGLYISVTAVGTAPKKNIVYRNGARENDLIFVSGDLVLPTSDCCCWNAKKRFLRQIPTCNPISKTLIIC